jgi:hypothetical protein
VSRYDHGSSVLVGCSPFNPDDPKLTPDDVLRHSALAALGTSRGKMVAEKDLLLDGWPGTEYRMSNPQGFTGIGRTYVVNDSVITLYITSGDARALDVPAKKVFSSFRLPRKAGKGPLSVVGPVFKPFAVGKTGVTVDLPSPPEEEKNEMDGPYMRTAYRYMSKYVTRTYAVGYFDLEQEITDDLKPAEMEDVLHSLHQSLADGIEPNIKGVKATAAKLMGRDSLQSKFAVDEGRAKARIETVKIGPRIFFFMAVATPPWAKSAEFEKFFQSIKVE